MTPTRTSGRRRRVGALLGSISLAVTLLPLTAGAASASDEGADTVAFVDRNARYFIYAEPQAAAGYGSFYYGNPGDEPLMGDWDCDGEDTPAMYRRSTGFMYLRNSNSQGVAHDQFYFGNPGDVPIAGDFDGDGCDTISIYRPSEGRVYISNELGGGPAEYAFYFGNPGDKPFVGDFDGDGVDTIGLHRRSTGLVYFRNDNSSGVADSSFIFGDPGDIVIAGDWNGDGYDTVAAYRPSNGIFYMKYYNEPGIADATLAVGTFSAAMAASGIPDSIATVTPVGEIDVEAWPGDDLGALADQYPEGTVFLVHGTHYGQEIEPKDDQVFIGAPDAVLDGQGAEHAFRSNGDRVVIRGFEIRNYSPRIQFGAIHGDGSSWIVENNDVHDNATVGILVSDGNVVVRGNNIHNNGQLGLAVDFTTNGLVEGNTIAFNNPDQAYDWGFEAGGTKFWSNTGLVIRGNWVHHNNGPGLWADTDNIGLVYEENTVEDNYANGIMHEVSYDAVIRYNLVRRNGYGHEAWLWGSGILLSTSGNVEVYGNVVQDNYNGITMVQQDRGSGAYGPRIVENNNVHDNTIIDSGLSGAAEDVGNDGIFFRNNRFQGNDYRGSSGWEWDGGEVSWDEWRSYGHDTGGSYAP